MVWRASASRKRTGFKQFMAEEYLFSETHAGFHTRSSMKYSMNWRPAEFQHFIDVMCGPANLTRHVECLTSVCCVWHIHLENRQDPAGTFNMSTLNHWETQWKHVLVYYQLYASFINLSKWVIRSRSQEVVHFHSPPACCHMLSDSSDA